MEKTEQTQVESRKFRKALGRFASGIAVVMTAHEGSTFGMTANAFVSVSLDPPLVLVSVVNRANMHKILPHSGRYGVSVLGDQQEDLSQHFAGQAKEDLEIPFVWQHSVSMLDGALVHLVCRVVDAHPAGDHTLCIGRVEYLTYEDGAPLLFYTRTYRNLEVQVWDQSYW